MTGSYPKRLIEVDLPIRRISEHARREKSIRHGHISTLHIWWARRPLAACRSVILATLWPDPADPHCPKRFRDEAAVRMKALRDKRGGRPRNWDNALEIRGALLEFIGDFANWDLSNDADYLQTSRALVRVAHEVLGGVPGTKPLVVDPFAGGGAIPLEVLRVGADAYASDLNPVAVLLNKVLLEYAPKYGQRLADEVRRWGERVKEEADKRLSQFYPRDADGSIPVAYLWARTIRCEGPGCGADIPLLRSTALAKRAHSTIAVRLLPNRKRKRIDHEIVEVRSAEATHQPTVKKGAALCPLCGFTTPVERVRSQLSERRGGAADARLICIVTARAGRAGKSYRRPDSRDEEVVLRASRRATLLSRENASAIPTEEIPLNEMRRVNVPLYGMKRWADLFSPRQTLTLSTFAQIVAAAPAAVYAEMDGGIGRAVTSCLGLCLGRLADANSSLTTWVPGGEFQRNTFARQALPMVWDFAEVNPLADSSGNWMGGVGWVAEVLERTTASVLTAGTAQQQTATAQALPDEAADAVITDPPYYYSIPYANLSDYFYVWLKRALGGVHPDLLGPPETPKRDECIQNLPHSGVAHLQKSREEYERLLSKALGESSRITKRRGVAVVVFAHTDTDAWESLLAALVSAGWTVTASWPIDTEREGRTLAARQRTLASSIHLHCRRRETVSTDLNVAGSWREILDELPRRIHEWMPRLAAEGVVGADAIFACLGPALEVFSRFASVEKASGERVTLKEYLEHVWAAVAKEALGMIFMGADATGFEEDARLTAMWLWTLSAGASGSPSTAENGEEEPEGDEEVEAGGRVKNRVGGFALEYDAARKIAQGLGAHLEDLRSLVEVKGDTATLLPASERARTLFGRLEDSGTATVKKKAKKRQLSLAFDEVIEEAEEAGGWGEDGAPEPGSTVLDRVHQAMLLFAANRGAALKRFVTEDGAGKDERFWRLAQALSALYPAKTDEKRWIDGVLARKKSLGF